MVLWYQTTGPLLTSWGLVILFLLIYKVLSSLLITYSSLGEEGAGRFVDLCWPSLYASIFCGFVVLCVFFLPIGARGGLWSLIMVSPGNLFIVFFV